MRRVLFALIVLGLSSAVQAQTHYCDTTQPTSSTAVVGSVVPLQVCNDGKDSTGTVNVAPTSWKLYDNTVGTTITLTKGTTSAVSGKAVYSGSYTVPAAPGVHALQAAALSGTTESAKSATFTVTGVAAVPSVPTNLTAQ